MSEPNAIAAGVAGSAIIGASSANMFMGAHIDALVIGLIGAVFVSIWLETIDNRAKAFSAVMVSAMLAGYGSPVAAAWVTGSVPSISGNPDALRMLLALLISMLAPSIVPLAIRYLGKKVQP